MELFFTDHARGEMTDRGIGLHLVEITLTHGQSLGRGKTRGSFVYELNRVRVVFIPQARLVITAWRLRETVVKKRR